MTYAPQSKDNSNPPHQQQTTKATAQTFSDNRESTAVSSPLQAIMANSPQQQKLKSAAQLMAKSPAQQNLNSAAQSFANKSEPMQRMEDEEPLQGKFETESAQLEAAAEAPRPNNTGLPDNLKSGIENLSGMNMDHVRVHYNSDKPAQLQAHAYAQGSEIHVAPGQEQHLPHEAWHVVQQAQGRVKPTVQMKGDVQVNDDVGLEAEADLMGGRVLQMVVERQNIRPSSVSRVVFNSVAQKQSTPQNGIIQAYTIEDPASVQAGAVFKSQSIKKERYSRLYEKSSKTAIKSQHHGSGGNADGTLHVSAETQTDKSDVNLGGLPSVKVSANKKMAINNSGGQAKEFFAESVFIDTANDKLAANTSKVLLKKQPESIKVKTNETPLVRVVAAAPVPVSIENVDGLKEVFAYTNHECNEFIKQVVDSNNRVISLLGEMNQPNVEVPTGLMGEPVEKLMDYMVKTDTDAASATDLKSHSEHLGADQNYDFEQTAPTAYASMDAKKKAEMSEKLGLNEHALPDVGEGYVIASRFSEEQMQGIMKTHNAEAYLAAIKQLGDIDPNLDATQQKVESDVVKGMMRLWGSHYAAVVAKDGADTITYENYNRATEVDWEIIDIFNNLFEDFENFRMFVAEKTESLNLNISTAQAKDYINQASTALAEVKAEVGSFQDRYKNAIELAKFSITTALQSEANHKKTLTYFHMYGPAEQSFHASFKGQTSNPMTMRVAPSVKLAQKVAKDSLTTISKKFIQVLLNPGTNSPWKEIFTTFYIRFSSWHDAKSRIIEAGVSYKSIQDVSKSFDNDFNDWNSVLRTAIVDTVKVLVGDNTIAVPTSKDDVMAAINTQKAAHEVSSLNFTAEGYRKDEIYKKLEILRLGAVNLK